MINKKSSSASESFEICKIIFNIEMIFHQKLISYNQSFGPHIHHYHMFLLLDSWLVFEKNIWKTLSVYFARHTYNFFSMMTLSRIFSLLIFRLRALLNILLLQKLCSHSWQAIKLINLTPDFFLRISRASSECAEKENWGGWLSSNEWQTAAEQSLKNRNVQ